MQVQSRSGAELGEELLVGGMCLHLSRWNGSPWQSINPRGFFYILGCQSMERSWLCSQSQIDEIMKGSDCGASLNEGFSLPLTSS